MKWDNWVNLKYMILLIWLGDGGKIIFWFELIRNFECKVVIYDDLIIIKVKWLVVYYMIDLCLWI